MLERNPDYFRQGSGRGSPRLRIFPNPAMSVAALEKGEVDYVGAIREPMRIGCENTGHRRCRRYRRIGRIHVSGRPDSNMTRKPFSDLRVRRAFAHRSTGIHTSIVST